MGAQAAGEMMCTMASLHGAAVPVCSRQQAPGSRTTGLQIVQVPGGCNLQLTSCLSRAAAPDLKLSFCQGAHSPHSMLTCPGQGYQGDADEPTLPAVV